EYVKCPAAQAITIPDFYPFENAACLPVAFGTAWRMVVTHSRIRPNDTVLVLGAGGGVAVAAIQIAKLQGARVIATASTDDKLKPVVDRVLPLEQTAEGETALERRQVFGKVIITPGGAGAP